MLQAEESIAKARYISVFGNIDLPGEE